MTAKIKATGNKDITVGEFSRDRIISLYMESVLENEQRPRTNYENNR